MTLILGINLTDSVYLAADTRVTRMRGDEIVDTHDNLLKIWGNKSGIFCAVAGDAGLAKHLLSELRYQAFSRRGIESLREHIEAFVYETADAYWSKKGQTTDATLLFAGSSQHRKAYIDGNLIKELVDAHFNNEEAQGGQGDAQKLFTYSSVANMPPTQYRTDMFNTDLFAVQITSQGVRITDSKPGQHLVYGATGLVKEDIELKEIARLEFGNDDVNPMMMTSYINFMKDKRNLQGVSSTVVPIRVLPNGTSTLVTGTTYTVDINEEGVPIPRVVSSIDVDHLTGTFFRVENEQRIKLEPISEYKIEDLDDMTLLRL
jgi:hypothetical protein